MEDYIENKEDDVDVDKLAEEQYMQCVREDIDYYFRGCMRD